MEALPGSTTALCEELAAANARADALEKALEAMKDRDYEPIKKWIQADAPEAVRRAYAIMAKAETERDQMTEALAAARRECDLLRDNLQWMVTLADHTESKDPHSPWCNGVHEGTSCEGDYQASRIINDARAALAAPAAASGEEGTRRAAQIADEYDNEEGHPGPQARALMRIAAERIRALASPAAAPAAEKWVWGTCVDCPRDPGEYHHPHPEYCQYRDRYDHKIQWDAALPSEPVAAEPSLTKEEAHGNEADRRGVREGSRTVDGDKAHERSDLAQVGERRGVDGALLGPERGGEGSGSRQRPGDVGGSGSGRLPDREVAVQYACTKPGRCICDASPYRPAAGAPEESPK